MSRGAERPSGSNPDGRKLDGGLVKSETPDVSRTEFGEGDIREVTEENGLIGEGWVEVDITGEDITSGVAQLSITDEGDAEKPMRKKIKLTEGSTAGREYKGARRIGRQKYEESGEGLWEREKRIERERIERIKTEVTGVLKEMPEVPKDLGRWYFK